jgi:membrane associated rhomboid family serine protease
MSRIEEFTKNLIIINVLIFFAVRYGLTMFPLEPYFVLIHPSESFDFGPSIGEHSFKPIQIVSHMFMHGDIRHLIFNMMGLYFFGSHVERLLRPDKFILLYFTAGFVASLAQMLLVGGAVVGASGAIYGVLLAFATMLPNVEMMLMFIPVPIKAKYVAIGMLVYGLYAGITGVQDGIGHFAHVGGAITGFLMVKYWKLDNLR